MTSTDTPQATGTEAREGNQWADMAQAAAEAFAALATLAREDSEAAAEAITDLLADLYSLANRRILVIDALTDRARQHRIEPRNRPAVAEYEYQSLPYAAEDIEHRRIIFDARNLAEALADDATAIRFYYRENRVWERKLTLDELDEYAPGWRTVLEHPDDPDTPGRLDLQCAIDEDIDQDDDEVQVWARTIIQVGLTDRTPTHVTIDRTLTDGTVVTETVTVEADDLDDASWCWRDVIDATPEEIRAYLWNVTPAAQYAEANRPGDTDPRPAVAVALRSITQ